MASTLSQKEEEAGLLKEKGRKEGSFGLVPWKSTTISLGRESGIKGREKAIKIICSPDGRLLPVVEEGVDGL